MTTSLNSIKSGVETVLVGLNPAGTHLTQRKYIKASDSVAWGSRGLADIDRRFTVAVDPAGGWNSFGTLTEHESKVRMTVTIGHVLGQKVQDAQERQSTDCRQIILELTDPDNRPSGVWKIALVPPVSVTEQDQWIETRMNFDVTFAEANP
jgi:uncharacterized protein YcbX